MAPAVFTDSSVPVVAELNPDRRADGDERPAGGQGVLVTSQSARRRSLSELLEEQAPDAEVARMARSISRRLSLRRPRNRRLARGTGALTPLPYAYRSDDIDIDRTIEALVERPLPAATDVVVRERTGPPRAVVLIVDVSGSMRGEKVRIAAATVAALAAEHDRPGDQLAVVAFWSDAAVLQGFTHRTAPSVLVDQLLRIPARGLTNVGFGLSVGHAEYMRARPRHRSAVLLTDAVHNAGPDPRTLARRFGELHVLVETDGEHDLPLARDLARCGHGSLRPVRSHRDVAPALNRVFASGRA